MNRWVIALYEKIGRQYQEIGLFFDEECEDTDAYLAFVMVLSELAPPWQVFESSKDYVEANPDEPYPEYEVRLINNTSKRTISSFLWTSDIIKRILDETPPKTLYRAVVKIETFPDEVEIDEDGVIGLDWAELDDTNRIEILSLEKVEDNDPDELV
jgi:hypothetical protein